MTDDRHLDWQGCHNARDLGGLRTADGGETRWGAVVRADAPDQLSADGWAALEAHGIRTIVDLRNDDELRPDLVDRPPGLTTLHLPLDGDRRPRVLGPLGTSAPAALLRALPRAPPRPGGGRGRRDRKRRARRRALPLRRRSRPHRTDRVAAPRARRRCARGHRRRPRVERRAGRRRLRAARHGCGRRPRAAARRGGDERSRGHRLGRGAPEIEQRLREGGLGDDEVAAIRARLVGP